VSWAGQRERINRNEILASALETVRVTRTVSPGDPGGGAVDTLCLPVDLIPGWLFGITSYKQFPAARFAAVMEWLNEYATAFE
jgi:hypothetical protein